MPVNFNLLRQAGPADFTEGLMQGQEQQNALLQQQQQRQLGEIQLRNALRGEQQAMAEAEAVKGSASLADLAARYRKAGLGKQALDTETALAKQQTDRLTAAKSQMELMKTSATKIMNRPESAIQELTRFQQLTGIDMSDDIAEVQRLNNPDAVKQWAAGHALEADKLLPKFQSMSVPGVGVQTGTTDYTGRFTPGQVFKEQMSEYQKVQNKIAQDRLAFEQNKFAWEKANPGFELKEAEDGSIVGVNKRTLQAFPITMGGAAPATAPATLGAGGPRMAAPAVQAIPGMTSVLDQQAPSAAPMAGAPLRGKGTALTESQGNATAYGMRMKEANAILEPLEKAGKTNTGLISGAVGGAAGLIPFIGEKLEGVSGSVFNALPQVLGGLSPEQQKVAQARINFITAILRKESGAAIGANEFATAEKNYFPKPGDDAATIAQKQAARKTAIRAMEIQAGPGARQMGGGGGVPGGGLIPGATPNNPFGLPGM
jgi:hypothetical protein